MKQTYISPDLQQCLVACERGFSLSTPIVDWGNGENVEGEI